METHPASAELLSYLAGVLDPERDAEIERHLASCDGDCEARLRKLEDERERARASGPPPVAMQVLRMLTAGAVGLGREVPVIPGYEVETPPIGHGGMGVVYLAYHDDFGVVALKTIKTGVLATPEQVKRFRREMEQAKAMSDRALDERTAGRMGAVRVFEVGEHGGVLFLSMELAAGGTVKGRIEDLSKNPRECARLIEPVARSLHEMHEAGGVHRDVTPGNILLQLRPGAHVADASRPPLEALEGLLSDYGLAKQVEVVRDGHSETFCGTHAYLAPELLSSGGDATRASDIYSLGATLYHMLSGDAPFGGAGASASPKELFDRIAMGHPTPLRRRASSVPADLDTICLKCLERSPKRRYESSQALADDLRRFLRGERICARRAGVARRAARWCARNRALVVTLVILLLTVATAAALVRSLAKERDLARTRAAIAEAEQKRNARLAHEANVEAARAAVRRGDWITAAPRFAQAIQDGGDDQTALRAERLFGFFAMADEPSLRRELEQLEFMPNLGRLTEHVALVHGALDHCDSAKTDEGRARVRKALAHRENLTFSPADIEFAEALADPRLSRVVKHLKEAVRLDPLHYTAQTSLLATLVASGELQEARRRGDLIHGLFPGAAQPDLTLALLELIDGNSAAMHARLSDLARRTGPLKTDQIKVLSLYCDDWLGTLGVFTRASFLGSSFKPLDALTLRTGVERTRGQNHDAMTPFAFPVPTIGAVFGTIDTVVSTWMAKRELGDADYKRLLALADEIPDALVIALAARNRIYAVIGPINRAEMDRVREIFDELIVQSGRAAEAGTVIPAAPMRYHASILRMIGDLSILKLAPQPPAENVARIRDGLHKLVADGRGPFVGSRQEGLDLMLKLLAAPVTKAQAIAWHVDTKDGMRAFEQRHERLVHLLRTLVDDWLDDEPTNKVALGWVKELERLEKTSGLE
jgi:hypothetical protein